MAKVKTTKTTKSTKKIEKPSSTACKIPAEGKTKAAHNAEIVKHNEKLRLATGASFDKNNVCACSLEKSVKGIFKWGCSKFDERHIVYALLFAFISALLNEFSPDYIEIFGISYKFDFAKFPIIVGGAFFGPWLAGMAGVTSIVLSVLFREQNIGEFFNIINTDTKNAYEAGLFTGFNYFIYGFVTGVIVGFVHCYHPKVKKLADFAEVLFLAIVGVVLVLFFIFTDQTRAQKITYASMCAVAALLIMLSTKIKGLKLRAVRAFDEVVITEIILAFTVTLVLKSTWLIVVDHDGYVSKGKWLTLVRKQLWQLPMDVVFSTVIVFTLLMLLGRLNLDNELDDNH